MESVAPSTFFPGQTSRFESEPRLPHRVSLERPLRFVPCAVRFESPKMGHTGTYVLSSNMRIGPSNCDHQPSFYLGGACGRYFCIFLDRMVVTIKHNTVPVVPNWRLAMFIKTQRFRAACFFGPFRLTDIGLLLSRLVSV